MEPPVDPAIHNPFSPISRTIFESPAHHRAEPDDVVASEMAGESVIRCHDVRRGTCVSEIPPATPMTHRIPHDSGSNHITYLKHTDLNCLSGRGLPTLQETAA